MGTLLLNLGQCGNQIGLSLVNVFEKSQLEVQSYLKRHEQGVYHSILVDTEPKIVKNVIDDRKKWSCIDTKNIIYQQFGRGNNWALGYMDSIKMDKFSAIKKHKQFSVGMGKEQSTENYMFENTQMIDLTMEAIRKEMEKTDYLLSISPILSLAGGTGSGLGSRMIEEMNDNIQDIQINAIAVFPNQTGETPLQHYNSVLSLSTLQTHCHSILYFSNEKVLALLNMQQGNKNIDKGFDINNINDYISSCLYHMFSLNDSYNHNRFYQDVLSECVVTDHHKFLELNAAPYFVYGKQIYGAEAQWDQAINSCFEQFTIEDNKEENNNLVDYNEDFDNDLRQITKDLITGKKQKQVPVKEKYSRAVSSLHVHVSCRSSDCVKSLQQSESHIKMLEKKLVQIYKPVQWNPDAVNLDFVNYKNSSKLDFKSIIGISNNDRIVKQLNEINRVAQQKFKNQAYLHWYKKYGIDDDQFRESFECLNTIRDNYYAMTNTEDN